MNLGKQKRFFKLFVILISKNKVQPIVNMFEYSDIEKGYKKLYLPVGPLIVH